MSEQLLLLMAELKFDLYQREQQLRSPVLLTLWTFVVSKLLA